MLLPRFPCSWPSGLYAPDERPTISIPSPAPFTVDLQECERTAPGVWSAPQGCRSIEGVLHFPPKTVRLAWPIYRAAFVRDGVPHQRCFDVGEFDEDFQLHVSGLPSTSIRLGLRSAQSTASFDIPQTYDSAGHRRLSSFSFRDSFRGSSDAIGDILIWDGTSWVSTGASLLNLSAIRAWLLFTPQGDSPHWLPSLGSSLRLWIEKARNALAIRRTAPRFAPDLTLPLSAGAWADEIWLTLLAFNSDAPAEVTAVLGSDQAPTIDPEVVKTLRWVCAARQLVEQGKVSEDRDGATLVADYQTLTPRLSRPEWVTAIADLVEQLHQLLGLDVLVSEWAAESVPPMRIVLRSRIAKQTGGRELTEAYVCARQLNYRAAYGIAALLPQSSGLVRDLAFLLRTIVRFRNQLPPETPPRDMHRKLQPFCTGIFLLDARHDTPVPVEPSPLQSSVLDPDLLPLHLDDITLLRRAAALPFARPP